MATDFEIRADGKARDWLETHEWSGPLVIGYDVHRCCGGGKICEVTVRQADSGKREGEFAHGRLEDGSEVWIDSRAARKLPKRFELTVRGWGRFRHLDLGGLSSDELGELLYT